MAFGMRTTLGCDRCWQPFVAAMVAHLAQAVDPPASG
jgi:hypothetical protein